MSSKRLSGKVLMPVAGKPIIRHIVDAAGIDQAVVLTSKDPSDDVLANYLKNEGIEFFRGSLNNVFGRFCSAIQHYQPDWVMRLCADSPFIPNSLIDGIANIPRDGADLVTNIFPRTFPKGHSVEILRSQILVETQKTIFSKTDKEHVTPYFYRNATSYKIISIKQKQSASSECLAIDTSEDYKRLCLNNNKAIIYDTHDWYINKNF